MPEMAGGYDVRVYNYRQKIQMSVRRQSPSSFSSLSQSGLCYQIQTSRDLRPLLDQIYRSMTKAYTPLRQYRTKKQNKPQLCETQILAIYRNIKDGCVKMKGLLQVYNRTIERQEEADEKLSQQINNVKRRNIELVEKNRFIESEYHKKMMELQGNFNKKQQDYESLINSFVRAIIDARKIWSDFEDKVTNLVGMVEEKNEIEEEVREFYSTVISMMHSMSTKQSINDSQIDQPCEMSSIIRQDGDDDLLGEDTNYDQYQEEDADAELRRIEESLKVLGSKGLFNKQNQEFLFKFVELKHRFSWNQLTKVNYYTQLLQFLKEGGNIEESMEEVHDNTIIQYNNEDSSSFLDYNSQKKYLGNFQQKAEDSLDGPSEINGIEMDHQIDNSFA